MQGCMGIFQWHKALDPVREEMEFLLTSAVSWCPGYLPLGVSKRQKQSPQP